MERREIRFDGWSVNFDSGEISKNGTTHRLQDQPLQILDELVKRPGEVVSREQLIARLWPTGVVEFDTGLNSAMRKLRVALGDDAETPRYIETLPRKGYRFVAPIEEPPAGDAVAPVAAPAPSPTPLSAPPGSDAGSTATNRRASDRGAPIRRLAIGFASVVAAVILGLIAWKQPGKLFAPDSALADEDLPTIVVLPLVDMSMDQGEQALCDGLTEELSNWLAHIPTLRVVARTSAFKFKGKNLDVRDIAKQLSATHVLEGSLRRSGEQLRITVQLIEAASGLHIWSRTYDQPSGDIFLIEDQVSRSVAEALHIRLAASTAESWAQRQPARMEAYEFYLLGRARQRKRTADDNLKSIEYFRRAVAADPQYALALTGLSESLMNGLSLNHTPLEDVVIEVEPLINRALQLSPNLADALAAKGWLLTETYKVDDAEPYLKRAVAANPNHAPSHRFLGNLYDRRAEPDLALKHYSASASLDPLDFIAHVFRCIELIDLGQLRDAGDACTRARELEPNNLWGPLATAWIARAQGDTEGALRWIDEARRIAPTDVSLIDQRIELLLVLRRTADARATMREVTENDSFFTRSREAGIVFAEGGNTALRAWLAETKLASRATTGSEFAELARLQYLANDMQAASATLAHAERILPSTAFNLFDGTQIRHEYSAAIIHAGIAMRGTGDKAKAVALLDQFDAMLDNYEKHGGQHYGASTLRAESLAIRGNLKEAEASLAKAWKRGWRTTWRVERDPYLMGIKLPDAAATGAPQS
jgi:TolB-like protein/DNA-binding winged helix-turn-helix (wHTH) protein/tetratricopeptide (TPR) repeat protein